MENGRLQNDLSAEFIIAHAEFIIASLNSIYVADDRRVYVLQLKEPNVSKSESCKHLAKVAKSKVTTHMDPLEDYQLICFSPFCQ